MIYLKSILAGIAVVVVVEILFMTIPLVVILMGGAGGWGWDISAPPIAYVPPLLIFAAGFYWEFRRISKRRSSSLH